MDLGEEKLGLGIACVVLMVGTWLTTNWLPGLATSLTTVVGGITGVYALFVGGHVTNAYFQGKNGATEEEQDIDSSPFIEPHVESNERPSR